MEGSYSCRKLQESKKKNLSIDDQTGSIDEEMKVSIEKQKGVPIHEQKGVL